MSVHVSGYNNYDEGVPADKEEAHSSTLSQNSPTRFTLENSEKNFVVHGDAKESALSNKESKHLDEWHTFSQISAENEKDKPTPLSQIGFRDPASIGGGQQLTILSMEVLPHSFLFCSVPNKYTAFSSFIDGSIGIIYDCRPTNKNSLSC